MIKRVLKEGFYLKENQTTIREVAKKFNVGKSTVHKDFKERLPLIDINLSESVDKTLYNNYINKHLRGGEKTRQKYQSLK